MLVESAFLIATAKFKLGNELQYSVAWILLTFLGLFGIHRFQNS
jgi:hypothetical protein